MFIQDFNIETDTFLGGEGVHVAANGVDLAGNLFGVPVRRALKNHVLHEMRYAVPLGILVTGAGLDPDPGGNRTNVGHFLSEDGESVGEDLTPDITQTFHDNLAGGSYWTPLSVEH